MKYFGAIFLLLNGLAISLIAGGVSVYGMTILFGGHALIVACMISSMEVGKLSAATWLKFNWKNSTVSRLQKAYLLLAVVVISALTAIGLFGFLSSAHLEQNSPLVSIGIQAEQFQTRLDQTSAANKRIEGRLAQIDGNINAFLTAGSASKGLKASSSLKQERDQLTREMDANNQMINDLNTKLAPIKQQSTEVEAKLGPIKYLANAMGYRDGEVAVRIVILLIMISFDPLAVILILSAMTTFKQVTARDNVVDQPVAVPVEIPVTVVPVEVSPVIIPTVEGQAQLTIEPKIDFTIQHSDPLNPTILQGNSTINIEMSSLGIIEGRSEVVSENPDPKEIRNMLLDMMEQYPEIVNELLATAKELETDASRPSTISEITGGSVN